MKESGVFGIGVIPENWKLYKNKYLFTKKKNIVGENFNEYKLLSLTTQGIKEKDINSPDGKLPKTFSTYQEVEVNDLILCLFDLDMSAVFSGKSNYDGMISPAYSIYECNKLINAEFAEFWFQMIGFDRKYLYYSKSLRNTINSENFNDIITILPPLNEQKKIINYLRKATLNINKVIIETQNSIEEYKKYKYALITKCILNGIDKNRIKKETNIDWIGRIPEEWEYKKVKYIFEIKKEIAGRTGLDILSVTQSGIKIKDISKNEGQIAADYSKYQIVEIGDFIMNHMDLLTGGVDCSKYYGVTSPDYRVFKFKNPELYSPEYYTYIMQICYKNKIFYGLGQGVANLGRWRLQTDKFLNFVLPVPPKEEQIEIVNYLDKKCAEIDNIIEQKQKLLIEMEAYKKSLIYECVTGKREVK